VKLGKRLDLDECVGADVCAVVDWVICALCSASPFPDTSKVLTKPFCGINVRVCALHYIREVSRECIKYLVC
jgi:hypothetical protein